MIQVPNQDPNTVSFEQKFSGDAMAVAKAQVGKLALAETTARAELDNANYRLQKATEALEVAEIAYHESIAKSAWNREEIRKAYNNALAGYRDADKRATEAQESLTKAQNALAGVRSVAKDGNIANRYGVSVMDGASQVASNNSRQVSVIPPSVVMNQNGVMVPDFSADEELDDKIGTPMTAPYTSSAVASAKAMLADSPSDDEQQATALASQGEIGRAVALLNRAAESVELMIPSVKASGDMETFQALALEAGRLRSKALLVQTHGFNDKLDTITKRDFSDKKRAELAAKGHAMPDGSFPIVNKDDLSNAVQSIGRAKDYKATKAHIISRANDLGATAMLPEAWNADSSSDNSGDMDESVTKAIKVLCPICFGMESQSDCPACDGKGSVSDGMLLDLHHPDDMDSVAKSFSTDALLTRDFEKSAGFQNYIWEIEKGGPGSGPEMGHEFRGNQWTGGMRDHPRLGIKRGWKTTVKLYKGNYETHMGNAKKAQGEADLAERRGDYRTAADKHQEAIDHLTKAFQAQKGIQRTHEQELARGSFGASADEASSARTLASAVKNQQDFHTDQVVRLGRAADAGDRVAFAQGQ